jgi:hypothetical protein
VESVSSYFGGFEMTILESVKIRGKRVEIVPLDFVNGFCQGCSDGLTWIEIADQLGMPVDDAKKQRAKLLADGRYIGLKRFQPDGAKRGRKGISKEEQEQFAIAYMEGCDNGQTIAQMAETAGLTYQTFSNRLKKIRESGDYPEIDSVEPAKGKRGRKAATPATDAEVREANALIAALLAGI